MTTAIFFLDPFLSFYSSQFFSSSDVVLPPSRGRRTPPNGSRAEQILSDVQSTPLSNHVPTVDPITKAAYLQVVGHFDRYVEKDLRGRVFVHAEHFFPTILHIRPDWRMDDEMTKDIQTIRDNPVFQQHMQTYVALCNKTNPGETSLDHPYGVIYESVFDVLDATDNSGLGIYQQDAKPVIGSEEKAVPDTLGVLRAMFASSGNHGDKIKDNGSKHSNFSWAQAMHWQEFKTKVSMLEKGTEVGCRDLSAADEDPQDDVQDRHVWDAKKRCSQDEPPQASNLKYVRSGTTPDVSAARNRSAISTALGSLREGVFVLDGQTKEEDDREARRDVMLKCGRDALDILSSAGFRTHSLGGLVTKGRIQLLFYDRSVIIVCKPIEMFKSVRPSESTTTTKTNTNTDTDTDTNTTVITDEFDALLVGLGRLTLKKRGIQEQFCTDRHLVENYKGKRDAQFEVTLGQIISRQRAIIGRQIWVVEAKSDYMESKGEELVTKISWPAAKRHLGADLVQIAREKTRTMKTGKKTDWALDHLPDILRFQEFDYDEDSTQADIAPFFKKVKSAGNKTFDYEHRLCRITVQERLYPLSDLRTVEDYAQVCFDILQIHKWLYDHTMILHRDISPRNIMWR